MGQSIVLLKKEFLELTIEIDREVAIEMSTGFGKSPRVQTVVTMEPVTVEEVKDMIDKLTYFYNEYKKAKKCPQCGSINQGDSVHCDLCSALLINPFAP